MKYNKPFKLQRIIVLILLITSQYQFAQIVAWDFDGNTGDETSPAVTTLDTNLESAVITRESGLVAEPITNAFGSSSFVTTGGGTGLSDAQSQDKILRIVVRINCGYQASFSTLDVNFFRDADGPMRFRWFYSVSGIGGGAIGGFNFPYTGTDTNGLAQSQIDLSGIANLQNVPAGSVVNFTLRPVEAAASTGLFGFGRLAGNDLSIGGTVTQLITTWNGSTWSNGDPDINRDVVINSNLDVTTATSFGACALTVNTGATLTIGNDALVEVENETIIDGSIVVETQGNFVQNAAAATFTLNGSASVNKTTPVKDDWFFYTYWSSPVTSETIGNMFADVDGDRRLFFSAANYEDADGDNLDDNNDDWQFTTAATVMTPGVGYAVTSSRAGSYPSATSVTFSGEFNSGNISTPVVFNPANSGESWNLIGNPYPGALDANDFIGDNAAVIGGSIYYWSQNTAPSSSNAGNNNTNFSSGDYAIFTSGSGGTAGGAGVSPARFVPSGQGFFVSAIASGNVTFTNAMRSVSPTTNNSQFFKTANSKKDNNPNKLWINLTTSSGAFSQILTSYVDGATAANDGLNYDAPRFTPQNAAATLYTSIPFNNRKYAIQGKAPSDLNTNEILYLGFKSTINSTTTFKLSIADIEGRFFNNNAVYIKDNALNIIHNLSQQDYTFTSDSGEFNDRFQIVFSENTLGTTLREANIPVDLIQDVSNNFKITSKTSSLASIQAFDLNGRILLNREQLVNSTHTFSLNTLAKSAYIIKVTLTNGTVWSKKIALR